MHVAGIVRTSVALTLLASAVSCSSDHSPPVSSCSCDLASSGVQRTLSCGAEECIYGKRVACDSAGQFTIGAMCSSGAEQPPSGSSPDMMAPGPGTNPAQPCVSPPGGKDHSTGSASLGDGCRHNANQCQSQLCADPNEDGHGFCTVLCANAADCAQNGGMRCKQIPGTTYQFCLERDKEWCRL